MWEINSALMGYWDPHMSLLVLRWLRSQQVYEDGSLKNSIKTLLSKTMILDAWPTLVGENAPEELIEKGSKCRDDFLKIESQIGPFMECIVSFVQEKSEEGLPTSSLDRKTLKEFAFYWQNKRAQIDDANRTDPTAPAPPKFKEFTPNVLELFLDYCRLYYDFGEYEMAKRNLLFYLDHICEYTVEARDRSDLRLRCIWGLLASLLVSLRPVGSVDEYDSDAYRVAQYILEADELLDLGAGRVFSQQEVLLERSWLIHWAIWGLCRHFFPRLPPSGAIGAKGASEALLRSLVPGHADWSRLLDWLFSEKTLWTLNAVCHKALRHVAAVAILNKERHDHFKSAVDAIARTRNEDKLENDPFSGLIHSLFNKCDFDAAQQHLALCCRAAAADFLLEPLKDSLEDQARLLIFQTYCRVQKSINIDVIAQKLNLTSQTAERWIVNLIPSVRREAKIDSEKNRVEIATQEQDTYQQVLEKARNLLARTHDLVAEIQRQAATSSGGSSSAGGTTGGIGLMMPSRLTSGTPGTNNDLGAPRRTVNFASPQPGSEFRRTGVALAV